MLRSAPVRFVVGVPTRSLAGIGTPRTPAAASADQASAFPSSAEKTNSTLLRLYVGPDTTMQSRPSTAFCNIRASTALKNVLRARFREPKIQFVTWNESVRTARSTRRTGTRATGSART